MLLIINFNNSPGVLSTANLFTDNLNFGIGSNNGKRHPGHNLPRLKNCLLVVSFVNLGRVYLNFVVGNVFENLCFDECFGFL